MKKQNNPNSQKKSVQIKNLDFSESKNEEQNFQSIDILFELIKKKHQLNGDLIKLKENIYGLFLEINNRYFKVIDFDKTILGYQHYLSDVTQNFLQTFSQSGCNITNYQESIYEVDSKSCLHLEREFQLIEILEFQGDIHKAINETETFEWITLYDKARQFWISQNDKDSQNSIVSFQMAFNEIEKAKKQYMDYKFISINLNNQSFGANEIQSRVIAYVISILKNIEALELIGKYQQIINNMLDIIQPITNLKQISICIGQKNNYQSEKLEDNFGQLVKFIDQQHYLKELTLYVYTQSPQFISDFANCLMRKTDLKTLKFELLKNKNYFYKQHQIIDLTEYCTEIVQQVQNLSHLQVLNLKINLNSKSMEIIAEQLKYLKDLVFLQLKFSEIVIQEDQKESLVIKLFNSLQTLEKLNYLKLSFDNQHENFLNDLGNELSKMKQVKYLALNFENKNAFEDSFISCFFNKLSTNISIEKLKIKILGEFQQESLFHLVKNVKNLSHLYQFKAQINKYLGPISKVKKALQMTKKFKRLTTLKFNIIETTVNWFQV
ncbi:hypothetical protein TTHERM_00713000 (macronuclear) [Tetrahymena thermophila SB210]|uniref:Uncharacterized protein n=1 Tax=Tetrahymena thermophila (strain SB210) TaxID=312017 RepID=Q24CZ2_TETTS|nr:hypothetical protein TTHERM_00713000 [Tetrahymena thermophila SB210]EAS05616.2 hypothetical protein TTHERM_00713000 [Tetrahymena thermophila SB210]|eukprot:XP_001025861.2 hypothetical protein TTHERM_00713000 [Tetrahymena thermophila SB210]